MFEITPGRMSPGGRMTDRIESRGTVVLTVKETATIGRKMSGRNATSKSARYARAAAGSTQ